MNNIKKLKVLIVDDSYFFREILSRGLSTDDNIEVVAKASDVFDARNKIIMYKPDVMTCDIEMPGMDGIEFIKRLMPQYKLPTIIISSLSDRVFDAMQAGAVEFITKPDVNEKNDIALFLVNLINKVKIAANSKVLSVEYPTNKVNTPTLKFDTSRIIAIGSSTGGTEALYKLLKEFPSNIPGIVIVQHIPPIFSRMFAERMNNQTSLNVKEAKNGDYIEPGVAFVAPGDKHMRIKRIGDKYKLDVYEGDKVNGHCPSVDVLFESIAKECPKKAVGVILTGMGHDGAIGLMHMRQNGAHTIGQDEKSSVVYGMPKAAYELGAVEKQLPLSAIAHAIMTLIR